ncbi:MAG: phosphoenolpyruvate--protein phosphotransferase [Verrucomicrobia bacterium]|nr:phosphoenolpyruvate--protein phosphotransferase [Verrucomicrobiota bacterium]
MPDATRTGEKVIRGIPVSAGVCRGRLVVMTDAAASIPRHEIPALATQSEIDRLEQALMATRQQVLGVQAKVESAMGAKDASIFDAHLLVLEDPTLLDEVMKLISEKRLNAEAAFSDVADHYMKSLAAVDDDYLRERATDMRDVTSRVLANLAGRASEHELPKLREPCIIVAHDLPPSKTAQLDKKMVLGFVTDVGGKTSHTAILARSLQIPAVVGLKNASRTLESGQYALLDGYNGIIILNPTDQTLFEYGQIVRKQVDLAAKLQDVRDKPAVTFDGASITLSANVEGADDIELVKDSGAEGVGLFRTEYLFINRAVSPTEEEQFQEYRKVAEALNPQPVIIRTLDLGGDKFASHVDVPKEMNPFLGWRAIRYCLQEPAVFRAQLRAILRASAFGNVKIMYPMISGLQELTEANAMLDACKEELRREGVAFNDAMDVGVMIEIPSAVLIADALAKRVKFFSIGTNDLIQYSLAVDRLNERIAHLYDPAHPAILRLIQLTVEAAHRHGIWCGVCGEMASDPVFVPLLLGLGVDELSAAGALVPPVKFLVRRLKMAEAKELAAFALNSENGAEVLKRAQQLARDIAPSLFENQ